jgi:myosin heavy subunit
MLPTALIITVVILAIIAGFCALQTQSKQKQLEQVMKRLEQINGVVNTLHQQLQSQKSECDSTRQELQELREKQKSTRQKMHQMRQEKEQLQEQLEEVNQDDPRMELELQRLREQLQAYQAKREELEKEFAKLELKNEQKLADYRSKIDQEKQALESNLKKQKKELDNALRKIRMLEHDLKKEKERVIAEETQMLRLEKRAENNDYAFRVTQNELYRAHRQLRLINDQNAALKKRLSHKKHRSTSSDDPITLSPIIEPTTALGLNEEQLYDSSVEEFIESLEQNKRRSPKPTLVRSVTAETTDNTTDTADHHHITQDPSASNDSQDPTASNDSQDPTASNDSQDPTASNDSQDPTASNDSQGTTTHDDSQNPAASDDSQAAVDTEEAPQNQ